MKQDVNKIDYAQKFISEALSLRDKHSNEQIIRANLCSYLPLMFDPTTKWVDDHIKGTEKAIHIAKDFGSSVGYIDNCIDATPIEYEKDLRIRSIYQEGYNQVKTYCAAMIQSGVDPSMILGILSDTLQWEVYSIDISKSSSVNTADLQSNLQLKLLDKLDITNPSPDNAVRLLEFLTKYLGREGSRFVNGANLAKDFGLNSKFSLTFRNKIQHYVRYAGTCNSEYYEMVKKIWEDFVYQIDFEADYQQCYVEEYYISILGKLLCANFLSNRAIISSDDELNDILTGSYFECRGYNNFAEFDYFGWLNELENVDDILSIMKEIQHELFVYDFASKPRSDLFGEILVELSAKQRRLLLGQELTPHWIAHEMLENLERMSNANSPCRYLDMCCGSGAFIVEALQSAKAKLAPDMPAQEVINILSEVVTGFDIDPLAVILAKINWIISVDETKNEYSIPALYIPIYHADSLFLSTPVSDSNINNKRFLLLRLHDKYIKLPSILISDSNKNLFDKIIDNLYCRINDSELSEEMVYTIVKGIIPDDSRYANDIYSFSYQFYKSLFDLNKKGKNGIWAFLIKNAFRPSLIRGDFTAIISNTPWLAMSKIQDCPYKAQLNRMATAYNIQATGSSSLHLELSTTFLIHAIDKYLADDGVFACILPHSILDGAQHEKFREGHFMRHNQESLGISFSEIWRWPNDTFNNLAITIFGRKVSHQPSNTIPGFTFNRMRQRYSTPFHIHTNGKRTSWTPDLNSHADHQVISNNYCFNQGADILPRSFCFFDLIDKASQYSVAPISSSGNNFYLVRQQRIRLDNSISEFLVSKKYFYPVLLSNLVLPFYVVGFAEAYIPFSIHGSSFHKLTSDDINLMYKTDKKFYEYIQQSFAKHKHSSIFSALNMRNKLANQNLSASGYMVVYCAGGARTCASYLDLSSLEKCPVIDQTLYYCLTNHEDEAIYLVGLLNSPFLSKLISIFQPKGAFGYRHVHSLPQSYIQQFDYSNELHQQVVSSTKSLMFDISIHKRIIDNIANPNIGLIQFRRTKFLEMLKTFKSYSTYSDACQNYFSQFS